MKIGWCTMKLDLSNSQISRSQITYYAHRPLARRRDGPTRKPVRKPRKPHLSPVHNFG